MTQVDFMKETASKTDINEVIEALKSIAEILFRGNPSSRFALNVSSNNKDKALKSTENFIGAGWFCLTYTCNFEHFLNTVCIFDL